ncbi:hypothetical protein [Halomonas sp. M20]|uniref:hypothetical protein n=1 Tax=Halomonas sp. M20 TaxID=2763264 RepID=UPI001D09F81C|nr:hypothetical protein [Halomonas sp. M20]
MSDFRNFIIGLSRAAEEFKKRAETVDLKAVHSRIEYLVNNLPKDIEDESIKLMNRGWFIWFLDGTMPDFSKKMNALVGKSESDQDSYMIDYIEENILHFESELCRIYPDRNNQIEDAFKSHHSEIYFSSIPTLLALSEGIGRDLYPSMGIFAKQKPKGPKTGLPKTDDIFDSISGLEVFEEAVLKPLRVSSEVTKTIYSPTEEEKKLLNRHLIMHGNSGLYGSKENSLKAISLVYFVHKSLEHLKNA